MCFTILLYLSNVMFDFGLRISSKSFHVALVNAIGRRSLIVGFFFFGTITVLDSVHESGLISSCLIIVFNAHIKTCVYCSYVPDILRYPASFYLALEISSLRICCFTSCTVIFGSSMCPVMLTLHVLSKCSCKIVDMCVFSSLNCSIASIS